MKIYLVRHGEDEDNAAGLLNGRRDKPLTQTGTQQANDVGCKLQECGIEVIYTSPLLRARQTAQIISNLIGEDRIVINNHLIERDFGILTGKPVADITRYTQKIINSDGIKYFLEVDGAEGFPTLYYRAQKFISETQLQHVGKTILVVSHGDIGKMIRGVYYGWNWEKSLRTPHFGNTDIMELSENKN